MSVPGILVCICVLEEIVHYAQGIITAQLQQEPYIVIYVSTTMSANYIQQYPNIVTKMCISFPKGLWTH